MAYDKKSLNHYLGCLLITGVFYRRIPNSNSATCIGNIMLFPQGKYPIRVPQSLTKSFFQTMSE